MANVNFATGGTGPYRSQIGWFNFGARGIPYNSTINITNTFLNIGNISLGLFGATNNAVSLSTSGASGVLFATGYTGVTGNPSILFNQSGTQDTGQVNITNISFTDFNGRPLKFYLVSGDAETTIVQNEYIRWVTNGTAWYNAATIPLNGASAPYNSVFSGFGTNTFTNTQVGGSGSATPISPVLLSKNPTQIQLSAIPQAGEAGGFGFIYEGLGATKSVSANYSTPGSILTYTIPVTAYGIATISNITLIDTLPTGITFNPGSLAINGVTISNQSFPSITLPDLPVGSTATISFRVTVNQNPVPNPIINSAFVQGIAGATQGLSSTTPVSMMTNSVVTTIVSANLSAVKSVTPSLASVGTTLTYTITLSNSGNTTALNVLFLDTISNSTALIPGTFKQDNTTISSSPNPPGVTLPNGIAGNSTSTVTFQVLVTTFPSGNIIPNNATASYSYAVTSLNFVSSATVSNTVDVLVSIVDLQGIKSVDKSFAKSGIY